MKHILLGLVMCACSWLASILLPVSANAQGNAPVIETFRIEKIVREGKPWLQFSWIVRNTDRVYLLQDGRRMESRIQLSDGSMGWPPEMPGAFRIGTRQGNFTLVATNSHGRVAAQAKLESRGCFVLLDPPGTRWERCRAGGVIATNLGGAATKPPAPRAGKCTAYGEVASQKGFTLRVPRGANRNAGYDVFDLRHVTISGVGSTRQRSAGLSGSGNTRKYSFAGLRQGQEYVVRLSGGWWSRPNEVRFRCPTREGDVRRHLPTLHAQGVRYD